MKLEQKAGRLSVKSTNDDTGEFVAVVSAFDVMDSYSDVIRKGAFSKSLEEWKSSGDPIPFLWDHATNDPFAYVGEIVEAKETDEGLEVSGRFDLDDEYSRKAYNLLKSRRVREYSFGYFVPDGGAKWVEDKEAPGGMYRELVEIDLREVSMTLFGANPATRTVEVRHLGAAGKRPEFIPVREQKSAEDDEKAAPATVADLDMVLEALDGARATLEKAFDTISAKRADLAAKTGGEDDEPEDGSKGKEGTEHTAASGETKAGEDPAGDKPTDDLDAAAVTVQNLGIQTRLIEIRKRIGK